MAGATVYFDRADPRLVLEKFLALTAGLVIELGPGSNFPGRIF